MNELHHEEEEKNDLTKKTEAAMRVRFLAKEDLEVRETLAMLGVIPPLVAMLDHSQNDVASLVASLYALLNLGIGNDASVSLPQLLFNATFFFFFFGLSELLWCCVVSLSINILFLVFGLSIYCDCYVVSLLIARRFYFS